MKKNSSIVLFISVLLIVAFVNGLVTLPRSQATSSVLVKSDVIVKESPQTVPESTTGGVIAEELSGKSDYVLPYPGILPDHPLYFLKELRDKIIETLIVDPSRKSEFYLLQSDKWLAASTYLIEKNQTDKAKTILESSSSRMIDAVTQLSSLKTGGRQIPAGSIDNLERSIRKHNEVLDELKAKSFEVSSAKEILMKAQEELTKLK